MKGFVYLLIFLLLALLFENIIKKFNITEGLECAPQENSLSASNAAAAKSQNNQSEMTDGKVDESKFSTTIVWCS